MMWNSSGHWGSGEWATVALIVIAVVAAVVAIIFLVRYLGRTGGTSAAVPPASASGRESPEDILKRRYAAGEIDREEYLQKLGDL
jgi:putative membrane protein